jgi:hypothetical protein
MTGRVEEGDPLGVRTELLQLASIGARLFPGNKGPGTNKLLLKRLLLAQGALCHRV